MLIKPIRESEITIKPIKRENMSIKPIRQSEISIKPIKKSSMSIKPISKTQENISFGAIIKPSETLDKGFKMALLLADSPMEKDLKEGKLFFDSIRKIKDSKEIKDFFIGIKRTNKGNKLPEINGRSSNHEYSFLNVQDSYIAFDGCIKFANGLSGKMPESSLDKITKRIIELEAELDSIKDSYRTTLKSSLEKLQKEIIK